MIERLNSISRGHSNLRAVDVDSLSVQPANPVDGFGRSDQDLLRVTAAQRAGAAKRARIDDRDRPTGVAAPRRDR